MEIISIQGPAAVGKSTLLQNLKGLAAENKRLNIKVGPRKSIKIPKDVNFYVCETFLKNQIRYFRSELDRWHQIKGYDCDAVLLDRGPEDTICFAYTYPVIIGVNWHIENLIPQLVERYIPKRSDLLIYLDASEEALSKRLHNDTNKKRETIEYVLKYSEIEKRYYKRLAYANFIDTTHQSPEKIARQCFETIQQYLNQHTSF